MLHQDIDPTTTLCDVHEHQDAITAASGWADSWIGRFGHQKRALLFIGCLGEDSMSSLRSLTIENEPTMAVTSYKHFGVYLSSDFKWSVHVEHVINNGSKKAGFFLCCLAQDLPAELISTMYLTCVCPTLENASQVWHPGLLESHAIPLERIQASVVRRILKTHWRSPKKELFAQLEWPSLRWRRAVATVVLLQKILNKASLLFLFVSSRWPRMSLPRKCVSQINSY